jgi:nucleoid-associated protein YgaU
MSREDMEKMRGLKRSMEEKRKKQQLADEPAKSVKKHVVESGETLSHIALKYYGSAIKEKWMIIYEANKDLIGDNPNRIRPGQEFIIPEIE